ncbi:MAG TPA: hypothetical protein VIM29_02150 [Bacillota bacterium]
MKQKTADKSVGLTGSKSVGSAIKFENFLRIKLPDCVAADLDQLTMNESGNFIGKNLSAERGEWWKRLN